MADNQTEEAMVEALLPDKLEMSGGDTNPPPLTRLPPEILHNVFSWLAPGDLDPLSRTCRLFNEFVKGNQTLCRDIYLLHLDTPPDSVKLDWQSELHDTVKLRAIFHGFGKTDAKDASQQLSFVSETVVRLLRNASRDPDYFQVSRNAHLVSRLFNTFEAAGKAFMQQSSLFARIKRTTFLTASRPPLERQQMSAKLHCLHGRPVMKVGRTRAAIKTHPYACSKVYDLRQYTTRTKWGPFRDDDTGRVDWEKLEAIMIVIAKNVRFRWPGSVIFDDIFNTPFFGSFPDSFAYDNEKENEVEAEAEAEANAENVELRDKDPYGITGFWYRIVCFLDYSDFFGYNFSVDDLVPPHQPRPPLNAGEAARIIVLKLHVTAVEPPTEDDHPDWPVVHYSGDSRALDERFDESALSGIRGTVRTTQEGEVRWSSVSVFDGQERWRSEGVQIGGRNSARGVWGNWFDRDYDPHGPAGPTAFWKASDRQRPEEALHTGRSGVVTNPLGNIRFPQGLAGLLEAADMEDSDYIDEGDDWEDEDEDQDDNEEWIAALPSLLAQELPILLQEGELGEAEFASIRQMFGLD